MNRNMIWIAFAVFVFLVNACGENQAGDEVQQTTNAATLPEESANATLTITPSAIPTVTPTATLVPTPTPAAAGNPIPLPAEPIAVSNASRIVGLAKWGKDESILEIAVAADGGFFAVRNDQGVDVYDGNTLGRIKHFEEADSILQAVPEIGKPPEQEKLYSPDGQYYLEETGPYTVIQEYSEFPWMPPQKVEVQVGRLSLMESLSGAPKQFVEYPWVGSINDIVFSPDQRSLAIGWSGMDPTSGLVILWNIDIDRSRTHVTEGGAMDMEFSPDGQYFASVLGNSKIKFWQVTEKKVDTKEGNYQERQLQELTTVDHPAVNQISFLGSGENFISISGGDTCKIWSMKGGTPQQVMSFGGSPIADFGVSPLVDVAISPNSEYVSAASEVGYVTIWEVASGLPLKFLQPFHVSDESQGYDIHVNFTYDNENLVILENTGHNSKAHAYQWSVATDKITRNRELAGGIFGYESYEPQLARFSEASDDLYILEGNEWELILRQATNLKEIKRFRCMSTNTANLLISPDRSLVLTRWQEGHLPCDLKPEPEINYDSEWHLDAWDYDGNWLREIKPSGYIFDWMISPDGRLLAMIMISGEDRGEYVEIDLEGIDILEIGSGNLIQHVSLPSLAHHYTPSFFPIIVEFSPDSSLIAVGNSPEEGDIALIRVSDGLTLTTLKGHTSIVTGLDFSTDGNLVASCSSDGTVRLWGIP